jgi:hypothetical protein
MRKIKHIWIILATSLVVFAFITSLTIKQTYHAPQYPDYVITKEQYKAMPHKSGWTVYSTKYNYLYGIIAGAGTFLILSVIVNLTSKRK